MNHIRRNPTLWTLRKLFTQISLTYCAGSSGQTLFAYCGFSVYSIPLTHWDGKSSPGLACADCAGWSESKHYAGSIHNVVFLVERLNYSKSAAEMTLYYTTKNKRNNQIVIQYGADTGSSRVICLSYFRHYPCYKTQLNILVFEHS